MKILMTVDPEIPVPPISYGGIERIADGLILEYTKQGHEVFLLANKDSTCQAAKMIIGWKGRASESIWDSIKNAFQLLKYVHEIKPDVIHSFSRLLYLWPALRIKQVKAVMTYQREISNRTTLYTHKFAGKKICFTSCGQHMTKKLTLNNKFIPIHNFTDTEFFTDDDKVNKDYLMYLGRIQDLKGTKEAIDVALKTNQRLIIAGNIHPGHETYFKKEIEPYFSYDNIEYIGPVNDEQKRYFLQRSKALLFPVKWEEPFGIVMAEAMACGTPVIGFRRGSVPEVIKEGETGFIVDTEEEMIKAINNIGKIDRKMVRKDCEERFSREIIANQYLALLKQQC